MPVKQPTLRTEEHTGPSQPTELRARDALLVAFPEPRVLPVPIPNEPIGREWLALNGIVDARVSTKHVAMSRPGGGLFVEDLGSRNGTWVNAIRLAPRERVAVNDGALLRIGRTLLVYRSDFRGVDAPDAPLGRLVGPYGLRGVRETIAALAARPPRNVLIEAETGAGKELVAYAVAEALGRAKPYAAANVVGIAAGVFESQLFGYVPGAYSGSGKGSPGIFVAHQGGAVFLDEIGELPLEVQPKLLRVLDNREVLPVGANRAVPVDVLVISATNQPLERMVEEGKFRRDLHARLAAARIEIPPLRERAEDIFAIAQALLAQRNERFDAARVEVEAVERLMLHDWKSNVRELAAAIDRVAMIEPPPGLRLQSVEAVLGKQSAPPSGTLTAESVARALADANGNESEAARRLGVTRGKLRRFIDGTAGR